MVITLRYLKFLFIGPPRSGKTSTRRRLVQEIVNLRSLDGPSKSTPVADTCDVVIKQLVCDAAAITKSEWKSLKKSSESSQQNEGDINYLARVFYHLISSKGPTTDQEQVKEGSDHSTEATGATDMLQHEELDPPAEGDRLASDKLSLLKLEFKAKEKVLTSSELEDIENAFQKLTEVLQSDTQDIFQQILEELTLINMVDAGGQPAFLEMLPPFTIGPALYFLIFRLDQELRKVYPVRFHAATDQDEIVLESSYCILDVIYQSLSSIACFASYSPAEQMGSASTSRGSSGALLFGTYKDQVDSNCICQMESLLRKMLSKTKLFKENLLYRTRENKLFFAVDNMDGNEDEMADIRQDVEEIIKQLFQEVPIPASWLMFRIILHILHKPVVTLHECNLIAMKLSMSTPVQEALWFFHHNIGSLMYYPEIPSMQDCIICDPQVVFDSVSELIIDTFKYTNRSIPATAVDDFLQRGLFTLEHISHRTKAHRGHFLAPKQLIDLLRHLNILAEIKPETQKESDTSKDRPVEHPISPKFIMPAVLKSASNDELKPQPVAIATNHQMCSLMIHFDCGFVPFGVFCAGIAKLIASQQSLSPRWHLHDDEMKKNRVTFLVDGAYSTTLISRPEYLEIQVLLLYQRASRTKSIQEVCCIVRQTVVNTLETVISKMKYKPYAKIQEPLFPSQKLFNLAFTCCVEDSHKEHLMKVTDRNQAECLQKSIPVILGDEHLIWFDKVYSHRHHHN